MHSPRSGRTEGKTDRKGVSGRPFPLSEGQSSPPVGARCGAGPGPVPAAIRRERRVRRGAVGRDGGNCGCPAALPPPGGATRERLTWQARIPHPGASPGIPHYRPRYLGEWKETQQHPNKQEK